MSSKFEIHFIDAKRTWAWRPEELATALKARGHGVIVYYNGVDTTFRSVTYRNVKEYDGKGQVQIYWADPHSFIQGSESDLAVYWSNGYEMYNEQVASFKGIDMIVTKSQAHFEGLSETIQKLSKTTTDVDKIVSIMPGLDRDQFGKVAAKEDGHFLYASPWAQGLSKILKIWPKIRQAMPEAKLSICYGAGFSARMQSKKKQQIESPYFMGLRQYGVENLGAVSRRELGSLFRRCDALLVSSQDEETFCSSAYKAQFAGCIPITTDHVAFAETVRDGGVSAPWKDFLATALQVAESPQAKSILRNKQKQMIFPTWDEVASAWEEEIRLRLDSGSKNDDRNEEANFS